MWYFNLALTKFFDLLLTPFQSFHPFWSLSIFSLLTGVLMLVIFRHTSNQKGIKEAKDRIKAHLMELRLFKDDLGIFLSAQKSILLYNAKYMTYALKPMLFMIVPVAIILIHLDDWFGYRPLMPGEFAIVSVKVSDQASEVLSNISIEVDRGLKIETPSLKIRQAGEVDWRIRATELGEHRLIVKASDHTFEKRVIVSDGRLTRVSPTVVASSLWDTLLNPGERPLTENSLVKRIEVDYPSRSIEIFGWETHWMIVFFVLAIFFGFVMKGWFGVEI